MINPANDFRLRPAFISLSIAILAAALLAPSAGGAATDGCPGYREDVPGTAILDAALAEAGASGRRVVVVLGANYCQWCGSLCETFERPEIRSVLAASYVEAKIDVGKGDLNPEARQRLGVGRVAIPHVFVLEADGSVLVSQSGSDFGVEPGRAEYVHEMVHDFLRAWAPPPPRASP